MIWCIMTYIIAYVKTQKIRFIIHYVKPTAQLLFRIISKRWTNMMCVSPQSLSFLNWIQVPRFCLNYFNANYFMQTFNTFTSVSNITMSPNPLHSSTLFIIYNWNTTAVFSDEQKQSAEPINEYHARYFKFHFWFPNRVCLIDVSKILSV